VSAARTYADELLARFADVGQVRMSEEAPAKRANAANPKDSSGVQTESDPRERLRIAAKASPSSQTFAGVRSGPSGAGSEQGCGLSQVSHDSQGCLSVTDGDEERSRARRDRLLRWGWPLAAAEALAERLTRRDRDGDDRRSCAGDCGHYRPGRCGNHRRAGLYSPELGHDLAVVLQRCPGSSAGGASEPSGNAPSLFTPVDQPR
jgi:hypothetical protein